MLRSTRIILSCLILSLPIVGQASALESKLDGFAVVTDAEGGETFAPADQVQPGDTLEYRLTYHNVSDGPLSQLRLDGVVPPETAYIDGTAQGPASARFLVSIDNGNTFSVPPIKYIEEQEDGSKVEKIALPETYTNLRWEVDTLNAGEEMVLKYRVQVR